jgi:hypothetical protein
MGNIPLGLTLPIRLGNTGYFATTSDVLTQIRTNLKNLLLTQKGERLMQPDFGCDIYKVIFQPMTDNGLGDVRASIELAVSTWMPFITVNDVVVLRDPEHDKINVQISFSVATTKGMTDSITLVF